MRLPASSFISSGEEPSDHAARFSLQISATWTAYQDRLAGTALRLRIFFCIQRIANPPTEIRSHFLIAVPLGD